MVHTPKLNMEKPILVEHAESVLKEIPTKAARNMAETLLQLGEQRPPDGSAAGFTAVHTI